MLNVILKKEITEKIHNFWFIKVFIILFILFTGSVLLQYRDYQLKVKNYSYEMMNKAVTSDDLKILFMPENLSLFAQGLNAQKEMGKTMNPISLLFPRLDFMFIIYVFLSLIGILTGSICVAREYEQGTLRLILSNSVPRPVIFVGKWLANFLSFAFVLGLLFIFFALFLEIKKIGLDLHDRLHLGLIFLLSLSFLSVFLLLGLLVSVTSNSSIKATIVALFIWITLVFVIPNTSSLIGKVVVAPPKLETINQKIYLITQNLRKEANSGKISWSDFATHKEKEETKWHDHYNNKIREFILLSKNIMRLSPVSSYVFAVTAICCTGLESFLEKQRVLKILEGEEHKRAVKISSFLTRKQRVSSALADVFLILISNLLLFIWGYVSFSRKSIHREIY